MATARARVGYLVKPSMLVYATAGLAFVDAKHEFQASPASQPVSTHATSIGWVAGAGLEHKLTKELSLRGEAQYAAFPDVDYKAQGISLGKLDQSVYSLKVGWTFHFN